MYELIYLFYQSATSDQAAARLEAIPQISNPPVSPETVVQQVSTISSILDMFGVSCTCLEKVMVVATRISVVGQLYIRQHLSYFFSSQIHPFAQAAITALTAAYKASHPTS